MSTIYLSEKERSCELLMSHCMSSGHGDTAQPSSNTSSVPGRDRAFVSATYCLRYLSDPLPEYIDVRIGEPYSWIPFLARWWRIMTRWDGGNLTANTKCRRHYRLEVRPLVCPGGRTVSSVFCSALVQLLISSTTPRIFSWISMFAETSCRCHDKQWRQ